MNIISRLLGTHGLTKAIKLAAIIVGISAILAVVLWKVL